VLVRKPSGINTVQQRVSAPPCEPAAGGAPRVAPLGRCRSAPSVHLMQVVGAGSKAGNLLPSEADGGIRGDGCSIDACWVSGLRDWTLRTVQSATQPRLDWCGELGRASAEEFARLIACSVASDEGEAVTLRSQMSNVISRSIHCDIILAFRLKRPLVHGLRP
jgi:hypothetical protein